MSDLERYLSEQMKDPEFAAEYDALEAQYAFAQQVIAARIEAGLTQAELARRVGASQANISKLEHGTLNPSFDMARRVAAGLGKRLDVYMQ
ncbi:MAG: helix-turn-helix transcriptional regulator [Eubacteriales bacterium]|nr:helix-turn-helix transcriptional regulator [Eubacteriales bacterium]